MRWAAVAFAVLTLGAGGGPVSEWVCPDGWYVNGVRPDGRYEARPVLGAEVEDLADARARVQIEDSRRIVGWIWCWRPATPRQDGRRVWCER